MLLAFFVVGRTAHALKRRDPRLALVPLGLMLLLGAGVAVGLGVLLMKTDISGGAIYTALVGSQAILVGFLALRLLEYWRVGLRGVDVEIDRGITYERSLRLCRNRLDF